MRTREILAMGLLLVGVRLLWVGEMAPGEVEDQVADSQARSQRRSSRSGRGGKRVSAQIRLPDGVSPSRSRARRAQPDVLQVEVMEKDEEVMQGADVVMASHPHLQGQSQAEELDAGSWGEKPEARWKELLRPDMEFLMTKQSIHSTTERTGPRSPAMVNFRFKDHKGSTRNVEWEADFTEAAGLPTADWHWTSDEFSTVKGSRLRHRRCALVGNSGVLRHSGLGGEIDENDAVMRINYAPTVGYEKDVGSHTTYDLVNKENCIKLAKGEYQWRRPKSTIFLFESHSRIIRSQVYIKLLQRAPVKSAEETVLVLQPALMTASRSIYLMIKAEAEDEINAARLTWGTTGELNTTKLHQFSSYMVNAIKRSGPLKPGARKKFEFNGKPMSGMGALFVCMQMCEKTTMYGFDSFLDKRKQRYHYFDDREGMTEVHSFDLAMEVFHRIGEVYPVTVRKAPS